MNNSIACSLSHLATSYSRSMLDRTPSTKNLMSSKPTPFSPLIILVHGNVPPNDCQKATGQRHPNHAHGRRDTGYVITEMQFGQEESKRGRLHGRFNCHGARLHLTKASEFGKPVTDDASDKMEKEDGDLVLCFFKGNGVSLIAKRDLEY